MASGARPDFEELYRRHIGFVWRTLRRFGVPESVLEDAAHEVFVILDRHLPELDPPGIPAWLAATARRVASNTRRTEERVRRRAEVAPLPTASETESLLMRSEAVRIIEAFLASLDEPKREVFRLGELEGLRQGEIAKLLEMNVNTVNTRLRAAREAFLEYVRRLHEAEASNG